MFEKEKNILAIEEKAYSTWKETSSSTQSARKHSKVIN